MVNIPPVKKGHAAIKLLMDCKDISVFREDCPGWPWDLTSCYFSVGEGTVGFLLVSKDGVYAVSCVALGRQIGSEGRCSRARIQLIVKAKSGFLDGLTYTWSSHRIGYKC